MHQIRKVVVIGPECTGKSELSAFLANHFKTLWVDEYAREYLDGLHRPYHEADLLEIAKGQLQNEDEQAKKANKLLICDTNLLVIKIWSQFKYGQVAPELSKMIQARSYDLYLLTYIDIPWVSDPQREHPHQREELFQIYFDEMKKQETPFVLIRGNREERRATAIRAIAQYLTA